MKMEMRNVNVFESNVNALAATSGETFDGGGESHLKSSIKQQHHFFISM